MPAFPALPVPAPVRPAPKAGIYVAIDPGTRRAGYASGLVTKDGHLRLLCVRAIEYHGQMAERQERIVTDVISITRTSATWVVEMPEIYAHDRAKTKSVHQLTTFCDLLHERLYMQLCRWRTVKPREWKGNVPKSACRQRIHIALGKLPGAREVVENGAGWQDPDSMDALGILLWYTGLVGRGMVAL